MTGEPHNKIKPHGITTIIFKADNHTFENMTEVSVLVDSRGGNTRKVADAIAGELGITAMDVAATPQNDAKLLFLGSGTYGGKPGEAMLKFIGSGNLYGTQGRLVRHRSKSCRRAKTDLRDGGYGTAEGCHRHRKLSLQR